MVWGILYEVDNKLGGSTWVREFFFKGYLRKEDGVGRVFEVKETVLEGILFFD